MKDIKAFYNQINIPFSKFSNPSDTLLKLANAPKSMNKELTIPKLMDICQRNYKLSDHNWDGRPQTLVESQQSPQLVMKSTTSFARQFWYVFMR